MTTKAQRLITALCGALLFSAARTAQGQAPDLIIHHARIVTVDKAFSILEAMAVKDGKILRTGSNEEILTLKAPQTELLDLKTQMVLPGLIDSHTHPAMAAMTEFDHPIPDMESINDVLDYFKARARVVPEGQWI